MEQNVLKRSYEYLLNKLITKGSLRADQMDVLIYLSKLKSI